MEKIIKNKEEYNQALDKIIEYMDGNNIKFKEVERLIKKIENYPQTHQNLYYSEIWSKNLPL